MRAGSTLTDDETDEIKKWLPKQTTTLPSRQDGTAPTTAADLLSRITGGGKRTSNEISPAGCDDCFDVNNPTVMSINKYKTI